MKIEERRGMLDFELTAEKVKKKELMHFTRQLAVFVKAGIPITDALITIGDETKRRGAPAGHHRHDRRPPQRRSVLAAAAAKFPDVFPKYYVGILSSAELTGRLDESLDSLAEYIEREIDTRSRWSGRCRTRSSSWRWRW
jgi:type IV pilus assembly protein PilC